jgi:hypothetical protein
MSAKRVKRPDSRHLTLRCKSCGNERRFLEIMEFESHVVNGNLIYIHLVEAIVEEYRCCNCGKVVKPKLTEPQPSNKCFRGAPVRKPWPSVP